MGATAVVTTHEAKTNLSRLLNDVQNGSEIIIARGTKKIARLIGLDNRRPVRTPGLLKGKFKVAEDFDEQLPDDILDAFHGKFT
jgi:antitoxin (DNA-binding transcriptional repressor) of toxin-antitoxin stability system